MSPTPPANAADASPCPSRATSKKGAIVQDPWNAAVAKVVWILTALAFVVLFAAILWTEL